MEASDPPAVLAERLSEDIRSAVEDGWQRARRAHGSLALSLGDFAGDVLALVERSRVRLGLPFDEAALREDVAGLQFEDLYLARLCERGDERAWATLVKRYEPDLRSVLRRDWSASEAEGVTAEVLSELALPPPSGQARTRLGTYDGTGPLWAWLATIGIRTARNRWRRRREAELEDVTERVAPVESAAADMDDEVARFLDALHSGWAQLETQERLTLGWKHRDGLSQRLIAQLLGVSEPTASRLVTRGISKLKGHLAAAADPDRPPDAALWTRLERALSNFLESSGPPRPPEDE